jgi:hypothetical protein
MTGFADRPAGVLYDQAAENARAEFAPPRVPHAFAGIDGNRDLAMMARVAFIEIPELTRRFEAEWEPFVQRIHAIDGPTERETRGNALLAGTLGLHVIRGGLAA